MARYIDAEELYKILNERNMLETYKDYMAVNGAINDTPTADVVPKSEVEQLKEDNDRLKDDNEYLQDKVFKVRLEVAKEIFEEIERTLDNYHYSNLLVGEIAPFSYYDAELEDAIAELKKKYPEEK